MRHLAVLFAISILATGCGDDKSSGGGGGGSPTGPTCTFPADSCYVASGATFTAADLTTFGATCTGSGGTFAASGTCSVASTVTGYCAIPNGPANALAGTAIAGMVMNGYYYTPAYNSTTANADCTGIGGTWTGGSSGGGTTIRCLFAGDICSQLTGAMTAADITDLSGQCTGAGGTYAASACSTASTVPGYCSDSLVAPVSGGTLAQADYYYTPAWNATTAAADCFGTWVGGVAPVCGDGSVSGSEVCDGANLNGQSCISQGFTGGTLSCNAGCLTFNTSACTGGGGGTVESEPNGTIGTADGPYTADVTLSGGITLGDHDYFAVQNATGASVTVQLQTHIGGIGLCTSGDTVIDIYNSGGTLVGGDDDSGLNMCSLASITIPAGTTYYVEVTDFGNNTAIPSYQLVVNFP